MTISQIIVEIFEDFLEARGVTIPNPDREEDPDSAIIYGMDYAELEENVEDLLQNWMENEIGKTIQNFLRKVVTER